MNAVLRPRPKVCLYFCGWSDVPEHAEALERGFVFDISQVGHDPDGGGGGAPRWEFFGCEGGELDDELAWCKELSMLLELLKAFSQSSIDADYGWSLILASICAWGKQRFVQRLVAALDVHHACLLPGAECVVHPLRRRRPQLLSPLLPVFRRDTPPIRRDDPQLVQQARRQLPSLFGKDLSHGPGIVPIRVHSA